MKRFKLTVSLMILCALMLSLAACMNTNTEEQSETGTTAVPGVRTTSMPQSQENAANGTDSSFMPSTTNEASGVTSGFDWRSNAAKIEDSINQISEISESRVVVTGSTALVAVKFASAYKGEMTERIREMIAGVVREADPSIQTVAVTAEQADVDAVYGFADQIQSGKNGDDLAEDINRIVRNITTMR